MSMGACDYFVLTVGLLSLLTSVLGADNATANEDDSLIARERHRRLIPYMTFYYAGQQGGDRSRYQPLDAATSYSSHSLKPTRGYTPIKPSPQIPYPASGPATNVRFVQAISSYDAPAYATNSVYSPNSMPYSAKYNQVRVLKAASLAPAWAAGGSNRYHTVPYSAKYNHGGNYLPVGLANNAASYNVPYSAKYNRDEHLAPAHTASNDANLNYDDNYLPQIVTNDAKYSHKDALLAAYPPKYSTAPAYADLAFSAKYRETGLRSPDRLPETPSTPVYVERQPVAAYKAAPALHASQLDTLSQILDLLRQAGRLPPEAGRTPVYRVAAPPPPPPPPPAPTTPKPAPSIDDDDYAYYDDDDVDIPIPKSQANIKLTPLKPPFGTSSQAFPSSKGGTPGRPGVDYPILATIPETGFDCKSQRYKGFFGDPDTNCQVWHYCDLNGGQASFLCPNGTIFSQVGLTCDWWFNVRCDSTVQLYVLNERLYKYILPVTPSFPEDYSGPVVDRYLTLKFQEKEEKRKLKEKEELNKT